MAKNPAEDRLKAQRKAQAEQVKEMDERSKNVMPTPTQDENDRAKLGILNEELEDDGSPEQPSDAPPASPRASTASGSAPYSTRDSKKG